MQTIEIETKIKSDIKICFDLTRSIDFHKISAAKTNEEAIGGRISGLITLGEFVTWRATHFGIRQQLTSKITAYTRPIHFRDEQVKGAFKFFVHDHYFEVHKNVVSMRDVFCFQAPYGLIGKLFDKWILKPYLTKFLADRNALIKEYAETDKWKSILNC